MKIAFIGAGHITELLLNRLTSVLKMDGSNFIISDIDKKRCAELIQKFGVSSAESNAQAAERAEVIFICLKPEVVQPVINEIRDLDFSGKILISVSAGINLKCYIENFKGIAAARILPNPPSAIGEGAVPVSFTDNVNNEQREIIMRIVSVFGPIFPVTEDKIDIFTSLTSPAPVLTFCESMIDAAVLCGLDRATANGMVFQTVIGCLKMWEQNNFDLHDVIVRASTPAGTSVESLRVMDKMNFRAAVKESYFAAYEKSKNFGK